MSSQTPDIHPVHTALPLGNLNALRVITVLFIGMGYASTMPIGPGAPELGRHLGYDPSWFGLQVLFFLSGMMGWRSLSEGRTGWTYLRRRMGRTLPILTLYTLAVASILYPLLCQPGSLDAAGIGRLVAYVGKTISLISPGGVMPGALDDAAYMCLLQGTVWTLRWGALFHFGTLILHAIGMRRPAFLIGLFVTALIGKMALVGAQVWAGFPSLDPIMPAAQLGYPWMAGLVVWALRDKLPSRAWPYLAVGVTLFAAGLLNYEFAQWTPLIESLGTLAWCAVALALLHIRLPVIERCPALALPIYLGAWPTIQTILYLAPNLSVGALIIFSLAVSVALAYVVWLFLRGVFKPPAASQLNRPRTA